MKVPEIYQTKIEHVGISGSAPRLEQAGVGSAGNDRGTVPEAVGTSQSDQVNLSSAGREMQQYLEAARQVPDVRADKVQEIKQLFESGNYRVDAYQLAEKMVKGDVKGDNLNIVT